MSQPVSAIILTASCTQRTSPLPMTGTETLCFTAPMMSQSAGGSYICARVRPWTQIASAPASSQYFATSTALTLFSSQPLRILTVTGRSTAAFTARTMSPHSGGFFISALPQLLPAIFGTGQPMLMSIASGPACAARCRGEDLRVVAEKLDGDGVLLLAERDELLGLFVVVLQRARRDHLRHAVRRAERAADLAERAVGRAGHRGQRRHAVQRKVSDFHKQSPGGTRARRARLPTILPFYPAAAKGPAAKSRAMPQPFPSSPRSSSSDCS